MCLIQDDKVESDPEVGYKVVMNREMLGLTKDHIVLAPFYTSFIYAPLHLNRPLVAEGELRIEEEFKDGDIEKRYSCGVIHVFYNKELAEKLAREYNEILIEVSLDPDNCVVTGRWAGQNGEGQGGEAGGYTEVLPTKVLADFSHQNT